MAFSQKTLATLEFSKICERLADCAATEGAKARARALMPSDDIDVVRRRQLYTAEAKRLINYKGFPAFSAPETVPGAAQRAYKGAVLSPRELLDIASLLFSAREVLDYINTDLPFETALDPIFRRMIPNRELEEDIKRSILSEDMIADEASPALADIRRKIRLTNTKIKETLSGFVGGNRLKYLQENIVTMRNGRYVVPVKAEFKSELKGLVHDTSASGATLFVEPMSVVEANNDLKALAAQEQHEIERILTALSAQCGEVSSALELNYHNIVELSFDFACAQLALSMKAEAPIVTEDERICLYRARHPLLDVKKVVPIDVHLGGEFNTLIITGPNTGGKTVTLKTLGLFVLMAQSGLQLPASERSEIGVFDTVLCDMGDEQSIEASLSTFSSHMVNIVDILGKITDRSLVLFDELGSGTDPIEGAALAISILESVGESGALCASTTHYSELKVYALETPGVKNGSCEFDVETLRPTYRLIIGAPGKSNAFAISEKLGLPSEIIERANKRIERDDKRFEDVIERLDTERMAMEKEKQIAENLRAEYEAYKNKAEADLKSRVAKTEEEIEKQATKARQILESARASSEFIFRQLEDIKKQEDKEKRDAMMNRAREEVREKLRATETLFGTLERKEVSLEDEYHLPRPLKVGDTVYLVSLGREGTVSALADKSGNYSVTSGILKTKVPESGLRLVDGNTKFATKKQPPKASEGKVKKSLVSTFHAEIDVRGLIGEDAWFLVDKYLDDAVLAGVPSVRIIHGKGTGALRAALWKYFKTDPRVKAYHHGAYGEGDSGVTVIEFENKVK